MPLSAVAYMVCATQERQGVKLKYRHTHAQQRAILDFMKEEMANNG